MRPFIMIICNTAVYIHDHMPSVIQSLTYVAMSRVEPKDTFESKRAVFNRHLTCFYN